MKYIIANWKSNQNLNSTKEFFQEILELKTQNQISNDNKIIIAPPFNLIDLANREISEKNLKISLAIQNLSSFPKGSYTGEVGPENIKGQNVKYAILGHSERRKYFNESSELIAQKIKLALRYNLTPILCLDMPYLEEQALLVKNLDSSKIIVAYEPLEAIGTGSNQDPELTTQKIQEIKKIFSKSPILYGGSVKADNAKKYLQISDGVLVGGASLEASSWFQIMNA